MDNYRIMTGQDNAPKGNGCSVGCLLMILLQIIPLFLAYWATVHYGGNTFLTKAGVFLLVEIVAGGVIHIFGLLAVHLISEFIVNIR